MAGESLITERKGDSAEPEGGISTETLAERVRNFLRGEILRNRIPMGQRLREGDLAKRFGISRAPVREALRELAAEGWVSIVPRHGAVVTTLSREEFLEGYQVREALEGLATRLAVPRLTDEDLTRLRRLHEAMVAATAQGDIDTYFRLNFEFHSVFVERSGNRRLRDMYVQLMDQMKRTNIPSVALRGGMRQSIAEHEAIIAAAEQREPEKAARMMVDHIRVPQLILEQLAMEERNGRER